MTVPILTVRPEPGSSATVAAGLAAGLTIEACPLFEIRPVAWEAPPPDSVDALLLGSANAVRHSGEALEAFRSKPVYAVGEATARAAEGEGFAVATMGPGTLQPLVDGLQGPQRLLRLTGAEQVPVVPPPGIGIEARVVYDSVPLPLPDAVAACLTGGIVVLLHSAAAARHFAAECDRLGILRSGVRLAALGPRIAAAAGEGWGEVRSAAEPREAALLALARHMCHEPPQG
jgi:uroporphyrinogen-III synthase